MQNAQLLSHVDTDLVTRDQLRLVPVPEATRTWQPIPHIELVESLEQVLQQNQIAIQGEQFALRRDGSTLFGVLQLVYESTSDGRAAMGIRTSNNKTMSIQICAGLSVFVCDNLVFRGDLIALNRKHTSGLNLRSELSVAVLRFQDHFGRLTGEIDRLRAKELTDPDAKALIHDVFVGGVLPVRFLPQVSEMYFAPPFQEWAGRNAWSLHNAFTAAAKQCPCPRALVRPKNSADSLACRKTPTTLEVPSSSPPNPCLCHRFTLRRSYWRSLLGRENPSLKTEPSQLNTVADSHTT